MYYVITPLAILMTHDEGEFETNIDTFLKNGVLFTTVYVGTDGTVERCPTVEAQWEVK